MRRKKGRGTGRGLTTAPLTAKVLGPPSPSLRCWEREPGLLAAVCGGGGSLKCHPALDCLWSLPDGVSVGGREWGRRRLRKSPSCGSLLAEVGEVHPLKSGGEES